MFLIIIIDRLKQLPELSVFFFFGREPYLYDMITVMNLQFDIAHLFFQDLVWYVGMLGIRCKNEKQLDNLANYGFRETAYNMDTVVSASAAMKEASTPWAAG